MLAKDNQTRVSVIIVSFNAKEKLLRCLRSVKNRLPSDHEVIVVDNASSDGSAGAVQNHFADVTLISSHKNIGFGAGNNLAAQGAKGEFLVFLNPDTSVEPNWLMHLLRPFQDPSVGLVTSKILLMRDPSRINTCGNSVHLTGLTLCRGMDQPRECFDQPEEIAAVSGAAFAIRREIFETHGGFDEDFFAYLEETDLSLQAWLAGWRVLYEPSSIVYHDYSLRFGPKKVFYQERNRYLMLLKNFRWPTLLVLLPALLLAELVTWGFVLWADRGNYRNKLHAYKWIALNWKSITRKRRTVQSRRKVADRKLIRRTTGRLEFEQVSQEGTASLAAVAFNPLFFVLRAVTFLLVWW